ncbi:hemicentin-2-like [Leuresthes tenuis]|uniref:hemicentin-2-like n=1 Tax=Leuresthes tenuis TaxID=355514 RepID=UPI003B50A46A
MALWSKKMFWAFLALLAAAGADKRSVIYSSTSACAVRGSSLTLPCTFTPEKSVIRNRKVIPLKIVRVGWCQNHLICQDFLNSVYDSDSEHNDPRYQYLGDKKGNCTLQISDLQLKDNATFHFRMQADDPLGHFTNITGVKVTVVDGAKLSIKGSSENRPFSGGQTASLQCTSALCTFHPLKITWFRDGLSLPESGPVLRLGPLTAEDSGNYTCALETNLNTQSDPYSLQVEADAAEEVADTLSVIYSSTSACAVRGSSLTLPCTFTPKKSGIKDGKVIPLKIVRVGWCQNHLICQDFLNSVYDSDSEHNDPRYQYLGDKKGNCTLQISDLQIKDNTTFRFRMQADDPLGHFTNQTGVKVTVVDGAKLSIKGSSENRPFSGGQTASLQCTSALCTFHPLKITWFRDGLSLPESGPVLRLGPLTAEDSGNYTCALETNLNTQSDPYSLQVDAAEEG